MLTKSFYFARRSRRTAQKIVVAIIAALIFSSSTTAFANNWSAVEAHLPVLARVSKENLISDEGAKKPSDTKSENKADGKDSAAETAKMIESLEERIRQLEEKLARLNGDSTKTETVRAESVNVVKSDETTGIKADTTAVQDDAKKEEVKQNEGILKFFRDVEVSGIVDGYYSYNNNKVDMFTQGRAFDVRHNAFSLQLAKLTLQKANSKDDPLGFRVDLGLGETVDRIISGGDSARSDATKHVMQAYASYVAPIGSGLTIDFGKMFTPIGLEVIETKDNFNYSRSFLFALGPYYHTGFRAKYAFNDKVALSGFLFNGWDNTFENNIDTENAGKTVGFQLGLTPSKKFAITGTYLAGPEPAVSVDPDLARDNWRHIADSVVSVYVTDKLTLLGNFVYGRDGDSLGNRGYWGGIAGYLKYQFNNRLAFSPRFEVFNDRDGLRTGVAQSLKDITLTQEVKLVNNLITRFEFRRDFSNQKFFTNNVGAAKDNQNTFIFGVSYFFTNREP
ncbi:MAG: outer membrane beta-barrel protein [Blastocatellales bacterium]